MTLLSENSNGLPKPTPEQQSQERRRIQDGHRRIDLFQGFFRRLAPPFRDQVVDHIVGFFPP
jgi:hypothetical protein